VLELAHETYQRLIVEVQEPEAARKTIEKAITIPRQLSR